MKLRTVKQLIENRREHVFGRCNICGKRTLFFTKYTGDRSHVRESLFCVWCKSVPRKRHMAGVILARFAPGSSSLAAARRELSRFSIYSAVAHDPFHELLGRDNPNFTCSEYFPGVEEGEMRDGVLCQNLERLSFEAEQFDLVITEDVLEHVRRPAAAIREIHRVLRPKGYHIFTVPLRFDRKTVVRVNTTGDEDVYLLPPEYHGDLLREKILVYTDFGYDIFEMLEGWGFETTLAQWSHRDAMLYGIADSYVLISRKLN